MAELFNYSTFKTSLEKNHRTLFIKFNNDKRLGLERLFELESLFSWLTNKVEINTVVVSSEGDEFIGGWENHSDQLSEAYIKKVTAKIRKLNMAMIHLPQTFIFDLGRKAESVAIELSSGADIRIARVGCEITFNHLKQGIMPAAGTISMLSQLINNSMLKSWILSGKKVSETQLEASGLIQEFYDETTRNNCIESFCQSIAEQSPIQRIQTKSGICELTRITAEAMTSTEENLMNASLISQDWKMISENNYEFMPSKSFNEILRQAGIQKELQQTGQAEIKPFRRPEPTDH